MRSERNYEAVQRKDHCNVANLFDVTWHGTAIWVYRVNCHAMGWSTGKNGRDLLESLRRNVVPKRDWCPVLKHFRREDRMFAHRISPHFFCSSRPTKPTSPRLLAKLLRSHRPHGVRAAKFIRFVLSFRLRVGMRIERRRGSD